MGSESSIEPMFPGGDDVVRNCRFLAVALLMKQPLSDYDSVLIYACGVEYDVLSNMSCVFDGRAHFNAGSTEVVRVCVPQCMMEGSWALPRTTKALTSGDDECFSSPTISTFAKGDR